ncbi:hypothetical protein HPB50_000754 [Hyalomma asiaticum]|uniref:Uncharacterized protein n=1 Tax=Hyalomma asiaticum TaxID=266040 RepID=A0ACB7SQM8_HYAAI|nr:hypothetical protein HPB50_000754 [Hyalomma asiaticum]
MGASRHNGIYTLGQSDPEIYRQQPPRLERVVRQDLPGQHGAYIQEESVDQPTKEGSPVTAEIHCILFPYQVKPIRDQGMWQMLFDFCTLYAFVSVLRNTCALRDFSRGSRHYCGKTEYVTVLDLIGCVLSSETVSGVSKVYLVYMIVDWLMFRGDTIVIPFCHLSFAGLKALAMEDDKGDCAKDKDSDDEDLFISTSPPSVEDFDDRSTESYSSSESEDENVVHKNGKKHVCFFTF